MKICLIGNTLSNLVLAKNLISRKIKIDLFYEGSKKNNNTLRTISITQDNMDYFKNNIFDLKNISWPVKKINIFNESDIKNKILKFGSDKTKLFSIVKYNELLKNLNSLLQKEKNFKKYKIKKNLSLLEFINKKYNLVINSEKNNKFIKNYFSILVNKDYNSTAYTVIIDHKKCENKTATQIFTKFGPIAFLPISNYKTSIVFSILNKKKNFEEINIKELINQYNCNYKIQAFSKIEKFKLKYFFPRNYYFNNVLLFGDVLHQVHPLAGQGFNMTLRDIKFFLKLIDEYIDLGLAIDKGILMKFEDKMKHSNFIFSHGIDFIHEFFIFDNKFNNKVSNKVFKLFNKNNLLNKYLQDFANRGINI